MKIIYEDSELLLCYKEAGLAVQNADRRRMDLESMLRRKLAEEGKDPSGLHVIHRLDQPVEGLVLFALSPKAAAVLGQELTDGRMKKTYLALVDCQSGEGTELARKGTGKEPVTLRCYLVRDRSTGMSRCISQKTPDAKLAVLSFRVRSLDEEASRALLQIDLQTGRHHQIRAQLSGAGLPIIGDRRYGERFPDPSVSPRFPCLCAWRLSFEHPRSGKKMCFEVKPEDCPGQPFWVLGQQNVLQTGHSVENKVE